MDRGEKERERQVGVTVCDVLVTAVTHCNGVGLYFTGSISHGTNIHLSTHLFWNTHTHSHTSMGLPCVCDRQGSTSGFDTPGYKLLGHFNTLIYTFTDGNTVFMNRCRSDTCYGFNISLVPTLQWHWQCLGVKCNDPSWWCWALLCSLYEMEKGGIRMSCLQV